MTVTIALSKPLWWTKASRDEWAVLNELQGNILKSHGRGHAAHLFLHFDDQRKARAYLSQLADVVKSSAAQLNEAKAFRETGRSAGRFVSLLLSAAGYEALGVPERLVPDDPAFRDGMQRRGSALNDPPAVTWDEHLRAQVHAMLLIADDNAPAVRNEVRRLRWQIAQQGGVSVIGEEIGAAIKNQYGHNIEHFGYRDGISDPVMLAEDAPEESGSHWSPIAPLEQVLVRDPGSLDAYGFGSYVVFRKLEQNVRLFKEAEERLAHMLGLKGEDEERAGALIVGRFESGSPLVLSNSDNLPLDTATINNFSYVDDEEGCRCPFHAHIRKVNPRGESVPRFSETVKQERSRRIARRGIPYGERADDPSAELPAEARPTGGVGLLFIAYQRNISAQFEHIQQQWANNSSYVNSGTGLDPLIGQNPVALYHWPVLDCTTDTRIAAPFGMESFVMLKGGEYFFAPCISFLKGLA
jgi:Dyp-type peroxidase family